MIASSAQQIQGSFRTKIHPCRATMIDEPTSSEVPHAGGEARRIVVDTTTAAASNSSSVIVPFGGAAPRATPSIWKSRVRVPQNWRLEWTFPATAAAAVAVPQDRVVEAMERDDGDEEELLLLRGAARRALESHNCGGASESSFLLTPDQTNELAGIMTSFSRWVRSLLSSNDHRKEHRQQEHHHHRSDHYRAVLRFDASRGKRATKCPKWHCDNVPFRWIQSLVGPGVDVVPDPGAVDWSYLLDPDRPDLPVSDHNRRVLRTASPSPPLEVSACSRGVDSRAASTAIRSVPEGEAVILRGGQWNAWIKTQQHPSLAGGCEVTSETCASAMAGMVRPAVHKSPTLSLPWQERVVIAIDLVEECYDDHGDACEGCRSSTPAHEK
jgi:hypothetical protein